MIHARTDYNRIQDPAYKIPGAEPVFLIRGQDAVGADSVRAWALLNEQAGGDQRLSDMARVHADKMEHWWKHKLADAPEEVMPNADLCTS